jgi:D-proline reductase (dithiol) PrdB
VGLLANAIEGAGISTVLLTVRPEVTQGVGAPRAMYVRFPLGNSLGEPHRPDQQRTILLAALDALQRVEEPGLMVESPFRWRRM